MIDVLSVMHPIVCRFIQENSTGVCNGSSFIFREVVSQGGDVGWVLLTRSMGGRPEVPF